MEYPGICQSCSMPILEEEIRGTEKDGSKSLLYCKNCYQDGSFTHPGITMEEMRANMIYHMDKKHVPADIVEAAIARLPHLERWRSKSLTAGADPL